MKSWRKWMLVAIVLGLLAGGALRTLNARKTQQAALLQQQQEQMAEVVMQVQAGDVIAVQMRTLQKKLPITGTVMAVRSAIVKSRLSGVLIELSVREGDAVRSGQVIARIDASDAQAQLRQAEQQVRALQAQFDIAQRTLDNNQALVAQGFISGTALQTSQAGRDAAQANLAAAQASVQIASKALNDAVVYAPLSGQVAQRLAQAGERVGIDARLLEIVDTSALELAANVQGSMASQLHIGQAAQLEADGSSVPVQAKVARINPSADALNRGLSIYLSLDQHTTLRPGQFLRGAIAIGQTRMLAVPVSAVRTEAPEPFVQVLTGGKVQHVKVSVRDQGDDQGLSYLGIEGVPEGSQLLSGRLGVVRAGTAVNISGATQGRP